jgi:glycosyltransferase involved in cell wall biosynthesis
MIKLSVAIITLNEEKNLERCLKSVSRIADEVVIVDSFSTDATLSIAAKYDARIIQHVFEGFVRQKNIASEVTTYNWVLSIDADEVISPELEQGILSVKANPRHQVYRLSRLTNYCGKWIKHSGWYPDKKIRLFDKSMGEWTGDMIHEKWQPNDSNITIGELKGNLLHYSFYTISDHVKKIEKYTEMSARAAATRGKSCSMLKIMVVPKWNFFINYIVRLGFLDGYYGFIVCSLTSLESRIKYAKTRQYAKWRNEGKPF